MSESETGEVQRKKLDIAIGRIRLLNEEKTGGIIAELEEDGADDILFNVDDFDPDQDFNVESLEDQIVQFVKEPTKLGLQARRITLLGSEAS